MPKSKKPQSKTRSMLRSARFISKLQRNNVTRRRKQAVYIDTLEKKQKEEFLAMIAGFSLMVIRKMEAKHKIEAVENCDGSFDVYYTINDSIKIVEELAKLTTRSNQVATVARQDLRRARRSTPGMMFSLKALVVLLMTSWATQTQAAFYQLSSPPDELSLLDVGSAIAIGVGVTALAAGAAIPAAAASLPLAAAQVATWTAAGATASAFGTSTVLCGLTAHRVGSAIRIADHARGEYPLSDVDLKHEALNVVLPGVGTGLRKFQQFREGSNEAREVANFAVDSAVQAIKDKAGLPAFMTKALNLVAPPPSNANLKAWENAKASARGKWEAAKESYPTLKRVTNIATAGRTGPSVRNNPRLGANLSAVGINPGTQSAIETGLSYGPSIGFTAAAAPFAAPLVGSVKGKVLSAVTGVPADVFNEMPKPSQAPKP